jgi:hypothetical protein
MTNALEELLEAPTSHPGPECSLRGISDEQVALIEACRLRRKSWGQIAKALSRELGADVGPQTLIRHYSRACRCPR